MKLLLLAFSGVRVQNSRLMKLGLTLPGFVERSRVIASLPSLGLLSLAAHTPPHWELEYRDVDQFGEPELSSIIEGDFDLIAISALSARVLEAYSVANRLRLEGTRVVMGGLHVTALPEEALSHADCVVVGEGEAVWEQLLSDFEKGCLQPLYSSFAASRFDLAQSRTPRYDLLDIDRYNRLTLQTTRGCPLDCEFCAASRTLSTYKIKPLDLVRRDLEAILAIWPRPFLELADDNTFVKKSWSRQLADLLGQYPIKWFTECDISIADDPELLERLAASGCVQVLIGLESAEPEGLRGLDSRGWKLARYESYHEKIGRIQSYGISVNGCFIMGLDSHTAETFEQTRQFVEQSALSEVQLTVLTPFPGTALYRRLRSEGRLPETTFWDRCTLFDVVFQPAQMSKQELESNFEDLMAKVYSDKMVTTRKANFRRCLRSAKTQRKARIDNERAV
jgi:radical SAM superfamily enzyme YgiQ (UPF0313 family)